MCEKKDDQEWLEELDDFGRSTLGIIAVPGVTTSNRCRTLWSMNSPPIMSCLPESCLS